MDILLVFGFDVEAKRHPRLDRQTESACNEVRGSGSDAAAGTLNVRKFKRVNRLTLFLGSFLRGQMAATKGIVSEDSLKRSA